ncbi:MAG: DMT family transporter [Gemmataceae bacterium]
MIHSPRPNRAQALLCIIAASFFWSLSGAFKAVLLTPTPLGLDSPPVQPMHIAFYRVFFAGLVLLPTLRRRDVRIYPRLLLLPACFAAMNWSFSTALASGTAANAIFLQYAAPVWVYLAGIFWLGETPSRRATVSTLFAAVGVVVILSGSWGGENPTVVSLALASGVFYAGVLIGLRTFSAESPRWLTVLNHLSAAAVLLPMALAVPLPSPGQLAWLFLFGAVQLGLPYWLMARGLKTVGAQEAGMLTLLEPLLNPLWAYLVSPATESPPSTTWLGGSLILGGLAYRYWPPRQRRNAHSDRTSPSAEPADAGDDAAR